MKISEAICNDSYKIPKHLSDIAWLLNTDCFFGGLLAMTISLGSVLVSENEITLLRTNNSQIKKQDRMSCFFIF